MQYYFIAAKNKFAKYESQKRAIKVYKRNSHVHKSHQTISAASDYGT